LKYSIIFYKEISYILFNKKGEYLYRLGLNFRAYLIKNGFVFTVFINDKKVKLKYFDIESKIGIDLNFKKIIFELKGIT